MILIADSGSTKCVWALCNKEGIQISKHRTIGFNPKYTTIRAMISELEASELSSFKEKVKSVIFYGAGCSTKKKNNFIKNILTEFFTKANIKVKHDLEGAYIAAYSGKPIICCILGTGSNSCLYDGEKAIENAPSLGYILGDEASGNYFGKKLVNLYVNNQLSPSLATDFGLWTSVSKEKLIENIYEVDRPNLLLATFFPFIYDNKQEPIFDKMLKDGVAEFFKLHIACYNNYQNYPLAFVGSVAYFLKDYLYEEAAKHKCTIDTIIKSPIKNIITKNFS